MSVLHYLQILQSPSVQDQGLIGCCSNQKCELGNAKIYLIGAVASSLSGEPDQNNIMCCL